MAQAHAGIDIGSRFFHLLVWKDGTIRDSVTEPLPEGLIDSGRIISPPALGDFIKEIKKTQKIKARWAALTLHDAECFCRRVELPAMSSQQLRVNLPYEFRDFISDDKDKYFYDYAMMDPPEGEEPDPSKLDLMAAAVPKERISLYRDILRRAGFDLRVAVPEVMAYTELLRNGENGGHGSCSILDLGHANLRIHMFRNGQYHSGRTLDYGCGALDGIIAEARGVDPFLARTYRESNYENCQELPGCTDVYNGMALEVMKAVNYYNFSSPDQPLERVYCCGGGVETGPLMNILGETLNIPVVRYDDLLPQGIQVEGIAAASLSAVGAAMQKG